MRSVTRCRRWPDYDVAADAGAAGGRGPARARAGRPASCTSSGLLAGRGRDPGAGPAGQRAPAGAAHPRPRGNRIDEVEFHPAWHELMAAAVGHGLHAAPWADARPGAHVARAARFYVWTQVEAGHGCPVSMTYAAVPGAAARARRWPPGSSRGWPPAAYEPGLRGPGRQGRAAGRAWR